MKTDDELRAELVGAIVTAAIDWRLRRTGMRYARAAETRLGDAIDRFLAFGSKPLDNQSGQHGE